MRSYEFTRFLPYFLHIGPKLVGFIFGVALLALGLPGLSRLFGSGLAPAAELSPAELAGRPVIEMSYEK